MKRIAAWLYRTLGGDDAALGRLSMDVVAPRRKERNLSPPKRRERAVELAAFASNEHVKALMADLMAQQVDHLARNAKPDTLYGIRGTMMGIALVQMELDAAVREAAQLDKQPRTYDKHSVT